MLFFNTLTGKENLFVIPENKPHNIEHQPDIPAANHPDSSDEEVGFDLTALRDHQHAIINSYLPEFYEFQQTGCNTLYPKPVDINALQARINSMQIPTLLQPLQTQLEQTANAFLDRFRQFRKEIDWNNNSLEFIRFRLAVRKAGWDDQQTRDYNEALKYANRLGYYLSGTLNLIDLLNGNLEWQTSEETIRKTGHNVLLNELLPVDTDDHNNQYCAQIRANLAKKHPDNIKFNAIVNSVTWDDRMASEALYTELERLSKRLLSGIALTKNHAKKIDKKSESSGIIRDIVALCQVLLDVIEIIKCLGKQIRPLTNKLLEEHKLSGQKEEFTLAEVAKQQLMTLWKVAGKSTLEFKSDFRMMSDKAQKNVHRIPHTLSCSSITDADTNKAVFQAGIMLLDKIQQTEFGVHKARQASRLLQQAVTHYSELERTISDMPSNKILDARLRFESGRWQEKVKILKKRLQQTIDEITTLTEEYVKQKFLSALRNELNRPRPLASNSIISDFDIQVKMAVDKLASIEQSLSQALLRLSEHGETDNKEFDGHTITLLQNLKCIKGQLKTNITKVTGRSINNFSRTGMLARRMGEVHEMEKQRYLRSLSSEDLPAAQQQYDILFFELIQHYLPILSKEPDPQGDKFLQRLRLEANNAAKGTTIYPTTMTDILAGMKSPEQAIRNWSERKLIRWGFLVVCLEGVKLIPNLAAFPLRGAIKFVITSAKVAWIAHKGRKGIRGGESDITDEIAEYAKWSYKTAAIKVVLSLPPGLATMLGITSIALNVYEGGLEDAGRKIAKAIMGEAPWHALNAESRMAVEAYTTTLVNAGMKEEEAGLMGHTSVLQQQTDTKPFSDNSDEDVDQHRIGRKWEAADEMMLKSGSILDKLKILPDEYESDTVQTKNRFERSITIKALQVKDVDFNQNGHYKDFSSDKKKTTYLHAIKYLLLQIENDENLSQKIRHNAYLSRIGAPLLVPVDISGYKLNNTLLLPDNDGGKSGMLIVLDSRTPYYYVSKGKDILDEIKFSMPYNAGEKKPYYMPGYHLDHKPRFLPSGYEKLQGIINGKYNFDLYFNQKNPNSMNIPSISSLLANTIEADYKNRKTHIENNTLVLRAILGSHIPDPDVSVTQVRYNLGFSWDNLTPAEYLNSFSRPFAKLSGLVQLIASDITSETIQETDRNVKRSEYIGSWIDISLGAATSFTPQGLVLNGLQSAAEITSDVVEGKTLDPLSIAALILMCIPGEKIVAKIGKFSNAGSNSIKYALATGNKIVDLAIVGRSIKTAVETRDPLAIYQAFLTTGMSIHNSYEMAKNMSAKLNIPKKMEILSKNESIQEQGNKSQRPEIDTSTSHADYPLNENPPESLLSRTQILQYNASSLRFGPIKPSPLDMNIISEPRAKELESQVLYNFGTSNKQTDLPPKEKQYYDSLVSYYKKNAQWEEYLEKGKRKYEQLNERFPHTISKHDEYRLRYEESTRPDTKPILYINNDGTVDRFVGTVTDINVKGEQTPHYTFGTSDDGRALVVDGLILGDPYKERDVQITRKEIGEPLKMYQIQGEFIKKNERLLDNIEFISRMNITNAKTRTVLHLALGEERLHASEKKPIVLKPEGTTKDAFSAMLTTPDVKPTARMLRHYPEFSKQIKEIRIQSMTQITLVLEPISQSAESTTVKTPQPASQGHLRADDNLSEYEKRGLWTVYSGVSGRHQTTFDQVTEHRINLNKFTKLVLFRKFSDIRIRSFDLNSSKYKDSNEFTLAHIDFATKKTDQVLSSDALIASVNDMKEKTDQLMNQIDLYSGSDKEAITENMRLTQKALDDIKININSPNAFSKVTTYALVRKNSQPGDINNHYGLVNFDFKIYNSELHLRFLTAHPYVSINKYPTFRDYLIRKDFFSTSDISRYNIKNVARYLGAKAIRSEIDFDNSIPDLKVKSFSFEGANPIIQKIGYKIESISHVFSKKNVFDMSYPIGDLEESQTHQTDNDYFQENLEKIKANVRDSFTPIEPIKIVSNAAAEEAIKKIMSDGNADIISWNIIDSKSNVDNELRDFSDKVIAAVEESYKKVSNVKSLFDLAESRPDIKAEFKELLNEATGLNDEIVIDIDKTDIPTISNMVYNKFKSNINSLENFLLAQKTGKYDSFVLFKYHQFDSSKPDAFALPYDRKKRILLAMLPDHQRHGGLVDTVTHEASHNAFHAQDYTYIGNVREETGSFPSSFEHSARDSRHFYENERTAKLSARYALRLPENANIIEEFKDLAYVLLQNSKLIKADTLLNSAEYNAYMIDVLSRAKIKDSHIRFETAVSKNKRSVYEKNNKLDDTVMLAALSLYLNRG